MGRRWGELSGNHWGVPSLHMELPSPTAQALHCPILGLCPGLREDGQRGHSHPWVRADEVGAGSKSACPAGPLHMVASAGGWEEVALMFDGQGARAGLQP